MSQPPTDRPASGGQEPGPAAARPPEPEAPPPAQTGPPPGGFPPAGPPPGQGSFPPQGPPPGQGGFPPQGPPPGQGGFPPPGPPPGQGGYPPPGQGGYPPPGPPPGQPGYPPPGQPGYPPPGQQGPAGYPAPQPGGYPQQPPGYPAPGNYQQPGYPQPGAPRPGAGVTFDMSKVKVSDWIVLGLGALLLIFSGFGWVTTTSGAGLFSFSYSIGGWHNFWFLAPLLVLLIVVALVLRLFLNVLTKEIRPLYLVIAGAVALLVYIISLIHILSSYTYSAASSVAATCNSLGDQAAIDLCRSAAGADLGSSGAGFGIWASIILAIAFVYFLVLSAQRAGEKLPVRLPGPNF